MAIPEILTSPAEREKDIIRTYEYDKLGYRVELVSYSDYRVEKAIEIEIAAMSALGDPPEEVREEFIPYNQDSMFFLCFESGSNGDETEIAAMGRIIPATQDIPNKSLSDLAKIPGWHKEGITTKSDIDSENNIIRVHETDSVMEHFKTESGCNDISKVWDIAILAPDIPYIVRNHLKPGKVAVPVINAFTEEVLRAHKRGELTHCTSFNEENAHSFFIKLGFNFHNLFDLEPMVYDSFGTKVGMKAQPAWINVDDIASSLKKKQDRFFEELAPQVRKNRKHAKRAAFTAAAVGAWSNVDYIAMMGAGEAIQSTGANKWATAGAVALATTVETLGTSYAATKGMGDFTFEPQRKITKWMLNEKITPVVSIWRGAGSGVMLDQANKRKVTFQRRLAHSAPYGAAVGAWVATPIPELVGSTVGNAVTGTAKDLYNNPEHTYEKPGELIGSNPLETVGLLGAVALGVAARRIRKNRKTAAQVA